MKVSPTRVPARSPRAVHLHLRPPPPCGSPFADAPFDGRDLLYIAADQDRVVLYGGVERRGDQSVGPFDGGLYYPAEDRWEHIPAAPLEPRDDPAIRYRDGKLIVYGGQATEPDGATAETPEFRTDGAVHDLTTHEWTALPAVGESSRQGPLMQVFDGESGRGWRLIIDEPAQSGSGSRVSCATLCRVSLPLTGERTVPGVPSENYWFRRHEVAYRDCASRIAASGEMGHVLDAGAGEGFGATLIRERTGAIVTALDYAHDATVHARHQYGLAAVQGNLVAMPFGDATFDAVVSLQAIEHLWDQEAFAAECARILRPGGMLVLSTPNRLTFPSGNLFHAHELTAEELADLVAAPLEITHQLGIHHGPRLAGTGIVDEQIAHEPHEWPDDLTALVTDVTTDDFRITTDELDECLDLLFVAHRG